jgi:hypothetical protein
MRPSRFTEKQIIGMLKEQGFGGTCPLQTRHLGRDLRQGKVRPAAD